MIAIAAGFCYTINITRERNNDMDSVYTFLLAEAEKIKIIDTHEHLQPHRNYTGDAPDFLRDYLCCYINSHLVSGGMTFQQLKVVTDDLEKSIEERYRLVEPYLQNIRNTAYLRSWERSVRILYGEDGINRHTIAALGEKFKAAVARPGYRKRIMREICNIDVALNDGFLDDMKEAKTELFAPVWRPDGYARPDILNPPPTFEAYLDLYKRTFLRNAAQGLASLKIGLAYERPIYFAEVDYKTADDIYKNYIKDEDPGKFETPLRDYMIHYALGLAEKAGIPVQIHTGLQEGMEITLRNSDPLLLLNLVRKYSDLTFDIFHMGYPFERELITLAKTNTNVNIDLCWVHFLSPYAVRGAFSEMLDVVPYTKLLGFGGDFLFYDGVPGHLSLAKENICAVLADKVAGREMTEDFAVEVLRGVFRENALRVYPALRG